MAVGKGHGILIQRGLQLQGLVTRDDAFDLGNYRKANYTTILWLWESNPLLHGPAPGFPWARWAQDETKMPASTEQPYLNQLVSLQLGDEWDLNDAATRDRAVKWFDAIRGRWSNTILYMNNWGGQVNDASLGDFINRAKPDMLSFDTYPFQSDPATHVANAPAHGSPTSWYGEMRRYRIYAQNAGIPWAVYRQTFHAVEGTTREYRSPSPSEMNLNTFGALAFGATVLLDFTYNTGASIIAPSGSLQPGYKQQAKINRRARNLGKALVHLTGKDNPLDGTSNGGPPTMDIVFIRGKTGPNAADVTPLPIGFVADNSAPNSVSEWEADRNDPYMRGWVVTNPGSKNGGRQGDVIISWFKLLDPAVGAASRAAHEGTEKSASTRRSDQAVDQLYFMVTNAFTGPDGTAADYRQRIQINFTTEIGPTLERLNYDTGEVELVKMAVVNGRRQLDITLDGGMGQLFKFNTGHAFVGD
jgi:hypothetical protein